MIQFAFKLGTMLAIGLENPKGRVARTIATAEFEIMKWGGKRICRNWSTQ